MQVMEMAPGVDVIGTGDAAEGDGAVVGDDDVIDSGWLIRRDRSGRFDL